MPRTGENIYKRKDGRWEGRYIKDRLPSGKAVLGYVYARSYKEVKEKLNLAITGKKCSSGRRTTAPTFAELSDQWLNSQKARVKISTYNKYCSILRSYILPHLGSICLEDLTSVFVYKLCDTLLAGGGQNGAGLSEKTVADTLSVIRGVVQYAIHMGFECPFDVHAIHVHQQVRELRILSPCDQAALYAYLCGNPCINNIGILICLLTGLRIGEVCALQWEDISFADHTIYVHQSVQRIQDQSSAGRKTKVTITSPKSVSGRRVIPIPQVLEEVLRNADPHGSGFVLSKDGTHLMEPRVLQYHFKKVLKELGIREINFHVLRHTFATRCIELGFDVKSLSEILGHSSVTITMNKYVHPTMELKRENMQRISSLFSVK